MSKVTLGKTKYEQLGVRFTEHEMAVVDGAIHKLRESMPPGGKLTRHGFLRSAVLRQAQAIIVAATNEQEAQSILPDNIKGGPVKAEDQMHAVGPGVAIFDENPFNDVEHLDTDDE